MIPIKIERREPVMRWIPVTERLPEEGVEVLVTHWGFLYIAKYEVFSDGVGRWSECVEGRLIDEVTAWMPLPEPWKGEER